MKLAEENFLRDYAAEEELLLRHIKGLYDGKNRLEILEAGCGRKWQLQLEGVKYKLTGVDLDEQALRARVEEAQDLEEAIVGDLRSLNLGARRFDVIYCSFVLEHIENAVSALENFAAWIRPGGLIILRFPDRNTVFGFVTRMTPLGVHQLYQRYLRNMKNAGRPGFPPYPVHHDAVVSREGIREFCRKNDLTIVREIFSDSYLRPSNLVNKFVKISAMTISMLSLGKLPWQYNNLLYLLRKQ